MNLSLPFLSKLSGFLFSLINIWLSCYQFLFIWILTRVVNFLSWHVKIFQLSIKVEGKYWHLSKKWGFVVFYSCFYVITSVFWQCWSNYSHTNKLNQQILLSDAKLTQYLLFTQNYEANLLAIDSHMLGFFPNSFPGLYYFYS